MRKLLLAAAVAIALPASAFSADRPVPYKAAPMVAAPVFSWTGCYVGANGGYGWAKETYHEEAGDVFNKYTPKGGAIGGQIGCDYQTGPWVVGLRGLWDWSNLKGHGIEGPPEPVDTWLDSANIRSFAMATARLGYTIQPDSLLYVNGGAAWKRVHFFDGLIAGGSVSTANVTRSGWTVGIGWEKMFAPNWSFFVEYDFADFGKMHPNFGGSFTPGDITERLQVVLVGLNYRFSTGKAPVVAKY